MKKFLHNIRMRVSRGWLALGLLALPAISFAEGETSSNVPQAVSTAITDLKGAADDYASEIIPFVEYVGIAFFGIVVLYVLFRVLGRFVKGR